MSDSSDNPSANSRDQIEARLVAMLLGEASAYDEEQLREQLKTDADLARFYSEIQRTMPLLREAIASGQGKKASRVQLSSKRRKELKQTFVGDERLAKRKVMRPEFRRLIIAAAAVIALLLVISALLLPAIQAPRSLALVERLDSADAEMDEKTERSTRGRNLADANRAYDESGAETAGTTLGRTLTEREPATMPAEPPSETAMTMMAGPVVDALKDLDLDSDGVNPEDTTTVDLAEVGKPVSSVAERFRGEADYLGNTASSVSGGVPASYRENLSDSRRFADLAMPESAEKTAMDDLPVSAKVLNAMDPASAPGGNITGVAQLESESLIAATEQPLSFAAPTPVNETRSAETWKESTSYYKRLGAPPPPGTPAPENSVQERYTIATGVAPGFKTRNGEQQPAEWGIQTQNAASPGRGDVTMGGVAGFGMAPAGGGGAIGGGGIGGGLGGYGGMAPPASGPAPRAPVETFGDAFGENPNGEIAAFGRDEETAENDSGQAQPGMFAFGGRKMDAAGNEATNNHYGYAASGEGKSASAAVPGQAQQGRGQGQGQQGGDRDFNWAKGKEGEVLLFDVDSSTETAKTRESNRRKTPQRGQAPVSRRGFFSNGIVMAEGGEAVANFETESDEEEAESLDRLAKQVDGFMLGTAEEARDGQVAASRDRGRSSRSVPGRDQVAQNKTINRLSGKLNAAPVPPAKPKPKPAPKPVAKQELARGGRVLQLAQQLEEKEALLEEAPDLNREISKLSADKKKLGAAAKGLKKEPPAPAKSSEPSVVYTPKPETVTSENAFSTFSLNVSDVSFKTALASLQSNKLPEPSDVRSEEFLNALEYRDPMPRGGEPVAFHWERARSPFAHDRDIVRFSVKTAALGRQPGRAVNLVCLLDNSGSMEREDRVSIVTQALSVLARKLTPSDRVSLITFSRTPQLRIDGMRGGQGQAFMEASTGWKPQGGTHVENGLALAYDTARKHFVKGGNNRVILLTDGAANMGNVNPYKLKETVEANRKQGIALDCFGIGWEGYNDNLLEVLARNGDGRYGFLNQPGQAVEEFEKKLLGAFQVAASDVKVQVEWNEKRVKVYRQVGYLRHQLKKEDFRNNRVDAAEISAAESGNAMYVVQVDAGGEGPLGVVRVRYKKPFTSEYTELEWSLAYEEAVLPLGQSSTAMKMASVSATFAEWLARNPYSEGVQLRDLQGLMAGLASVYGTDPRPAQLEEMIRKARILSGN